MDNTKVNYLADLELREDIGEYTGLNLFNFLKKNENKIEAITTFDPYSIMRCNKCTVDIVEGVEPSIRIISGNDEEGMTTVIPYDSRLTAIEGYKYGFIITAPEWENRMEIAIHKVF